MKALPVLQAALAVAEQLNGDVVCEGATCMVEGSGHAKTTATDLQSVDSTVSALPPSGLAALDSAVRDGVGSLNSAASYTLDSFTTPAPLGDEERAASDLQTGLADLDLAVRITNATSGP